MTLANAVLSVDELIPFLAEMTSSPSVEILTISSRGMLSTIESFDSSDLELTLLQSVGTRRVKNILSFVQYMRLGCHALL